MKDHWSSQNYQCWSTKELMAWIPNICNALARSFANVRWCTLVSITSYASEHLHNIKPARCRLHNTCGIHYMYMKIILLLTCYIHIAQFNVLPYIKAEYLWAELHSSGALMSSGLHEMKIESYGAAKWKVHVTSNQWLIIYFGQPCFWNTGFEKKT